MKAMVGLFAALTCIPHATHCMCFATNAPKGIVGYVPHISATCIDLDTMHRTFYDGAGDINPNYQAGDNEP